MKTGIYLHDCFAFEPRGQCPFYWNKDQLARLLDWYQANEIDVVEYWIAPGTMRRPGTQELRQQFDRYRFLATESKRRGFELWWLLTSNIAWKGAPGAPLRGQLSYDLERDFLLDPKKPANFEKCAGWNRFVIEQFPEVDAFDVFPADWGGWWDGTCDVSWFVKFLKDYIGHAKANRHEARFFANTWCIGFWPSQPLIMPATMDLKQWRPVWDSEVSVGREFVRHHLEKIPAEVGIVFPCHHWYRGFTQQAYAQQEIPDWPDAATLQDLLRPVAAWPHFIIENDPYHGDLWGKLSVRARYIRRLAGQLQQGSFETAMGNVYSGRQAFNVFAWSQLLRNPQLAAEDVFARFAAEVVETHHRDLLIDTLILLDNSDAWENDLPPWSRLPKLAAPGLTRDEAAKQWREAGVAAFKNTPILGTGRDVFYLTLLHTLSS